jgi:hypothetical protein
MANGKKPLIRKVLNILFGHLWVGELTIRYFFPSKSLATGINNTSSTCGKFATGVVDNGGTPRLANISGNCHKILK